MIKQFFLVWALMKAHCSQFLTLTLFRHPRKKQINCPKAESTSASRLLFPGSDVVVLFGIEQHVGHSACACGNAGTPEDATAGRMWAIRGAPPLYLFDLVWAVRKVFFRVWEFVWRSMEFGMSFGPES